MPDLLLELFSEEIPARMQGRAAADLRKLVTDALVEQGLLYEAAQAFATPRRLALRVVGLPAKAKDVREERRGPRVGAPEAALQGFLKSTGLASVDQLQVVSDLKKGDFYVAAIERPGRPTPQVVAEILPPIIRAFPWPKAMRWGAASAAPGSLRWVRPLHSILCTFASETETPEIVPVAVDGLVSGDRTRGHRFMAPGPIQARRFDEYVAALEGAKVVLDPARRRDIIRHDARDLAFAQGLEVVEDETLLEEVAGLVEWPVVLMGSFDESFLAIPPEVIRATIRANQKCFVLRASRRASGAPQHDAVADAEHHPEEARSAVSKDEPQALANRFILVANIEASDGGAAIVAGNERVVRARLSDAKFFWDTDRRTPLEDRLEKLKSIVFHEKLRTQHERVERIAALARELAPVVGADPTLAERAARLAKADLVTEMVGEFPELQGLMGRYYAAEQGEDPRVAAAIEDHYKPLGPSDRVPTEPVSVAVALADKLDTLVGFWAIDEKPTGSKDPYALRRAALGVIRLVLENGLRLPTVMCARSAAGRALNVFYRFASGQDIAALASLSEQTARSQEGEALAEKIIFQYAAGDLESRPFVANRIATDLLSFFHDRLKVYLRDRGARHDLIDAVLAAGADPAFPLAGKAESRSDRDGGRATSSPREGGVPPTPGPSPQGGGEGALSAPANDDLLTVVRRVEALGRFLDTEDGANLLAGYRRAANILRIEEKKDGRSYDEQPDRHLIHERGLPEEKVLFEVMEAAAAHARSHIAREDFEAAMRALAELRPAVDAFFDKVTVNAEDPALRENRLKLLAMLRRATREVADFSRIEG